MSRSENPQRTGSVETHDLRFRWYLHAEGRDARRLYHLKQHSPHHNRFLQPHHSHPDEHQLLQLDLGRRPPDDDEPRCFEPGLRHADDGHSLLPRSEHDVHFIMISTGCSSKRTNRTEPGRAK